MKKIIAFFKRGFKDLGYDYHEHIYWYEGKLYMGYVIVRNERFFWLPTYKRVCVCCDKEELEQNLKFLQS